MKITIFHANTNQKLHMNDNKLMTAILENVFLE